MSLLNDLFAKSLDPGYQEAAARRAASGDTHKSKDPRVRFSPAMVFGMVALGLLLTIAALQVRDEAPVVDAERESYIEKIRAEQTHVQGVRDQLTALGAEIAELEEAYLQSTAVGQAVQNELERVSGLSGQAPVRGPGVVVILEDSETQTGDPEELVLAADLQVVANGLWAAGAEAIAINGVRLTALSAIRGVDRVPLVGYETVSPPYEVSAIGDGSRLAVEFSNGPASGWLQAMVEKGPTYDIQAKEELALPAASTSIDYAQPQEVS